MLNNRSERPDCPERTPRKARTRVTKGRTYSVPGNLYIEVLRHQHDLSVVTVLHHGFVSSRGLGERQLLVDHGAQRAVVESLDQRVVDAHELGRGGVEQGHAEDRRVLVHGEPRVELDAAAVTDDRDAP